LLIPFGQQGEARERRNVQRKDEKLENIYSAEGKKPRLPSSAAARSIARREEEEKRADDEQNA
jgi:hypothetical protein